MALVVVGRVRLFALSRERGQQWRAVVAVVVVVVFVAIEMAVGREVLGGRWWW